jgi:hypothetical protein
MVFQALRLNAHHTLSLAAISQLHQILRIDHRIGGAYIHITANENSSRLVIVLHLKFRLRLEA